MARGRGGSGQSRGDGEGGTGGGDDVGVVADHKCEGHGTRGGDTVVPLRNVAKGGCTVCVGLGGLCCVNQRNDWFRGR